MSQHALFELSLLLIGVTVLGYGLSGYLAACLEDAADSAQPNARLDAGARAAAWLRRRAAPMELRLYRWCGVRPNAELPWPAYAQAILVFNAAGALAVYALQRLQAWLPLNPQNLPALSPDLALNTAVAFVTNTDWQAYAGETAMSYLTQMLGLGVQNALSAATGIAVALALVRGFARSRAATIGNPWVDLSRATIYVLLPLAALFALFLVGQGVIQNFVPYREAQTLEATHYTTPRLDASGQAVLDAQGRALSDPAQTAVQSLPMGPVASQEALKMLGTNGGGYFNANSAHPYENPTPLSNFAQMVAIFLLPAALCFVFGRQVHDRRQGWAIYSAMALLFALSAVALLLVEQSGNPWLRNVGASTAADAVAPALTWAQNPANLEGKETRFGVVDSALFATATTAASCGAVNAMHDSLLPLSGLVTLWNMMLGEVAFGGVGSGLYGMLLFALLAVFVAGLMIGRTPEYIGKKIEAFDMQMIAIAILITPLLVLTGTAVAVLTSAGRAAIANPGPHGFSEILYALTSAANNNGSAFAGLAANTPFYNTLSAVAMWFGRYAVIVPVLGLAGSLAAKQRLQASGGTLPTHGPLFVVLLIGTVVLVGALNYVPALALGPIAEHLMLPH